jgi:hypothetical protein
LADEQSSSHRSRKGISYPSRQNEDEETPEIYWPLATPRLGMQERGGQIVSARIKWSIREVEIAQEKPVDRPSSAALDGAGIPF